MADRLNIANMLTWWFMLADLEEQYGDELLHDLEEVRARHGKYFAGTVRR